ncbi:hypothetical protein LTR54_002516 [Friedmanniomyces endolithicus]|uniref:DUF7730 domain-containing protein n=1 Tax=Friedmanniomyces endolithicus TaxID=329885 RepID=A0AAN6J5Z4_9PEZI|nr:hypothetical protein LTS00_008942 [Friedmanniomyces endolithicus]KAK0318507.1 hypothetical protein LTR82_010569 [Friedmanniomyces endolithicus]KAK1017140.1 hypothetical protein LTR54_002516 [Friedmanniomyces endolithicus]
MSNQAISPAAAAQSGYSLLALPAELRNQIHRLVLAVGSGVQLWYDSGTGRFSSCAVPDTDAPIELLDPDHISWLRSCKQVYHEAVQILYAVNTFQLKAHNTAGGRYLRGYSGLATSTTFAFARGIGRLNAHALRRVSFFMGPIWAQDAPNRARRQTLVSMIRELQVCKRGLPKCHLEASLRLIISRVKRDSADFRFVVAVNPGAAIESLRKATADFQEAAAQETGDLAIPALEVGTFVSLLEDLGAELSYRKNQDESNNIPELFNKAPNLFSHALGRLAKEVETQSDYLSEEGTVALTTSKTLDITPSGVT